MWSRYNTRISPGKDLRVTGLTGARDRLCAASETLLPVRVVVVVKLATGTRAIGDAVPPPPEQEVKPRERMKASSPSGLTVTLPLAEDRICE